jgi:HEAT repeat protein
MPIVRNKVGASRETRRGRRQRLRELLESRDHDGLRRWAAESPHAVRTVFSALFQTDDRLRWRAIEALGHLAAQAAETDPETVRDWIRRILWNMMEESGGLMWHGPEAIGEMLVRVPELIPEYAAPLGSFRIEEPFEAGTYQALDRIAAVRPGPVARIAETLRPGLDDPDPRIRAHAAATLLRLDPRDGDPRLTALRDAPEPLTLYDPHRGELTHTRVGTYLRSLG